MTSIVLREPDFVRQRKLNSCWFACLQMLLKWHTGSSDIQDPDVKRLTSHFQGRSYDEIPHAFRTTHHVRVHTGNKFDDVDEIVRFLRAYGPFMGGGKVGKLFVGKRLFGHAILIYGVTSTGHVLHHDPTLGPHCKMKGDSYLRLQDGERLFYVQSPRVDIVVEGS